MDYADYQHLTFDLKPNGVLLITINRPEVLNATNARLHWELTQVWGTIDADPRARVALVTGAGRPSRRAATWRWSRRWPRNPAAAARTMREASDLVYNIINLDKPIVSAINGVAVGAGLVVALLADVSIIVGDGAPHRRPHAPGRRRRRPRRHHLAAPLRDGQGQVLPAHVRLHRRPRGRAHRAGESLRAARPGHDARLGRGRSPGRRRPARHPLHQARAQQLAAPGRPDLRPVAGPGDAQLRPAGRARGRARAAREAPTRFPSAR